MKLESGEGSFYLMVDLVLMHTAEHKFLQTPAYESNFKISFY